MSFITKSALRTGIALSVAMLGAFSFTATASAATLEVTSIENVRASALPGSTFEDGLSWKFNVTVPAGETEVAAGVSDLIAGTNVLSIRDNVRFSSVQGTGTEVRQGGHNNVAYEYVLFNINPALDQNPSLDGIQIQIAVDVKLPATTTPGSYSFNYLIESEAPVIIDTEAPVITPQADVTVEATGPTGTVVTYTIPTVTDNVDAGLIATCNPASGSVFAIGNTVVRCEADDIADNRAYILFNVIVRDTTAPAINPHSNITVEATSAAGAVVTYSAPTATDEVDGNVAVICSPISGSIFPIGNTTVNCSATDTRGNTANSSFVITVSALPVDSTGPVFAPYSDVVAQATSAAGANVTFTLPTAVDAVDGVREVTCSAPSGGLFSIGNTNISCYATDITGNISFLNFQIIVSALPTTTHAITTTLTGTNGSVTPGAVVNVGEGQNQSITITRNPGYEIAGLTVDGQVVNFSYPRDGIVLQGLPLDGNYTHTFTSVTAPHTITATFISHADDARYTSITRIIGEEEIQIAYARTRLVEYPDLQEKIDAYQIILDAAKVVIANPSSTRRDALNAGYNIFAGSDIFYEHPIFY